MDVTQKCLRLKVDICAVKVAISIVEIRLVKLGTSCGLLRQFNDLVLATLRVKPHA